jgi:hypothetical protein
MWWNITMLKNYTYEEFPRIKDINRLQSFTIESSIKIKVIKWVTNEKITQLLDSLNNVSESKGYGKIYLVSIIENIKSTVISLIWIN